MSRSGRIPRAESPGWAASSIICATTTASRIFRFSPSSTIHTRPATPRGTISTASPKTSPTSFRLTKMTACRRIRQFSSPKSIWARRSARLSWTSWAALWWADYTGALLANGGTGNYFFHYIPGRLSRGCNDSWGSFGMFLVDRDFNVTNYIGELLRRATDQPGVGAARGRDAPRISCHERRYATRSETCW